MKDSAHAAALAACLVVFGAVGAGRGDEGMWLYNNVPAEQLKKKYGFDVGADWLEHLQKASVRFNSGGSGSFVSADGLVLTNHHVGADALQKLGTKEKNYYRDGFHARSRADELKCEAMQACASSVSSPARPDRARAPGRGGACAHVIPARRSRELAPGPARRGG